MTISIYSALIFRFLICVSLLGVSCGYDGRVRDLIYVSLSKFYPCYRILDGTRQVGCHSDSQGTVGVLHFVDNNDDVDYVLSDPGGQGPFTVAMGIKMFRDVNRVKKLYNSGKVSGMLVVQLEDDSLDSDTKQRGYSEDSACPNDALGLYGKNPEYGGCKKTQWNTNGTGLRFMDFGIPIFLVNEKNESDTLREKCFETYNKPNGGKAPRYPLCAVGLTMFHEAAGNAVRCLRRGNIFDGLNNPSSLCAPFSDLNVYGFLPATNKSVNFSANSVLMLAARMDSFSMFADYDPGSESSLSNVILMLALAETLGRNKEFIETKSKSTHRHLMQMLFHGESHGYIGSSRVVWDIVNNRFPAKLDDSLQDQPALLSLEHLAMILEVNQVGLPDEAGYFIHVDPTSLTNHSTSELVKNASASLTKYALGVINSKDLSKLPLPPSSVQRFLLANRSVPALVISDHEGEFSNKFYNGFMDKPKYLPIDTKVLVPRLAKLANGILRYAFEWVSNGSLPVDWQVKNETIENLTKCFWSSPEWKCDIFGRMVQSSENSGWTNQYSSTTFKRTNIMPNDRSDRWAYWTPVRIYARYWMAYYFGDHRPTNESLTCDAAAFSTTGSVSSNRTGSIYTYMKILNLTDDSNDTYCVRSAVDVSVAKSPAFEIEGYDFASGVYSTWVESVWKANPILKIFLKPDPYWNGAILAIGVLILLLSLILTYLISSGSDVLYHSDEITAL